MENAEKIPSRAEYVVARTVYPVFFFGALGAALLALDRGWNLGTATGAIIGTTALALILLEAIFPAKPEWRITLRSFLRDAKYIASGVATGAAASALGAMLAVHVAGAGLGPVADLPLYIAVPLAILVFDFVQYWVHRWMHEPSWPLGGLMWRIHAAHHLPDRVYVLMHPAGHPLNDLIVRQAINIGLIKLIGFNADAVFLFSIVTATGGLFSHFNLDVRAGLMNYFFVSTELHRFHHSAAPDESGNYGVVTPFWDLLFGTFVYRPGVLPARLGVEEPALYPRSEQYWKVFLMPFRRMPGRVEPAGGIAQEA
jgi:sterol desaturase/sphingolipid hydroxylase (fatty acid hydroxylase superfamily)